MGFDAACGSRLSGPRRTCRRLGAGEPRHAARVDAPGPTVRGLAAGDWPAHRHRRVLGPGRSTTRAHRPKAPPGGARLVRVRGPQTRRDRPGHRAAMERCVQGRRYIRMPPRPCRHRRLRRGPDPNRRRLQASGPARGGTQRAVDPAPAAADVVPRRQDRLAHPTSIEALGHRLGLGPDPAALPRQRTPLHRTGPLEPAPVHGPAHRTAPACVRDLAGRAPSRDPLVRGTRTRPHRGLQDLDLDHPQRPHQQAAGAHDSQGIPGQSRLLLRAQRELGLPERADQATAVRRRPSPHRPAPASLPRRRRRGQTRPSDPSRTRPPRQALCRDPRPHRHPCQRTDRPHRRRRRADRLRVLAPDPGRQAPQRPLHPAAPRTQDPARRLDRQPSPQRPAQRPAPTRTRTAHHQAPRRRRPHPHRQRRRHRPRHPTPTPPRSPPRPSTGA